MTSTSSTKNDRLAQMDALVDRGRLGAAWPVGVVLLAFGVPLWIAGGRWTVEGWIIWVNWFLTWLGLSAQMPALASWGLLSIPAIAYLYSVVEVHYRPVWQETARWRVAPPLFWLAWLVIVGTDLGSTFTGLQTPGADAWTITRQVAADPRLCAAGAGLLTFIPEWMLLGAWRLLRRKERR